MALSIETVFGVFRRSRCARNLTREFWVVRCVRSEARDSSHVRRQPSLPIVERGPRATSGGSRPGLTVRNVRGSPSPKGRQGAGRQVWERAGRCLSQAGEWLLCCSGFRRKESEAVFERPSTVLGAQPQNVGEGNQNRSSELMVLVGGGEAGQAIGSSHAESAQPTGEEFGVSRDAVATDLPAQCNRLGSRPNTIRPVGPSPALSPGHRSTAAQTCSPPTS